MTSAYNGWLMIAGLFVVMGCLTRHATGLHRNAAARDFAIFQELIAAAERAERDGAERAGAGGRVAWDAVLDEGNGGDEDVGFDADDGFDEEVAFEWGDSFLMTVVEALAA